MASEFRFDNVRLLLADPNGQVRHGLKSVLFQQGFREVHDTGGFAKVVEAVQRNCIDVMITDAELPDGDVCELTHRIRHHKIGNNPFLVVLTMTAAPTEALVRRIVDSGSDDLVVKPLSPDTLMARIKTLARGRKPFVVTHDYIGPDRRKQPRDGEQKVPMVDVPNPLRSKAVANSDSASLQRLIDAAAARINQQKMERYAVQIGYLCDRVMPHFEEGRFRKTDAATLREVLAHLHRLSYVAEDLGFRMRGTAYSHVAELALSLIGVTQRIQQSLFDPAGRTHGGSLEAGFVDHRDVELLPKIAQALGRAFDSDKGTVEAAHKISGQVAAFTGRR